MLPGVAGLLGREIDLDALLSALCSRIADAVDADRGTLWLVDRARGELFSRAAHLPELPQLRMPLGQGIAGHVAVTGATVNVPTSGDDPRFFAGVDQKTGYATRSMLTVPMRAGDGAVLGVVQVLNKRSAPIFSAADEAMLAALAAQAAAVVEATNLGQAARPFAAGGAPPSPFAQRVNRIVGESTAMQEVTALALRAAATDASVLVRGESGTGKELVARAVHVNSSRREAPFVKVDCAALPAALVENELFGHERGAYTGADRRALGKFEAAQKGTVFLDEVGELPASAQGKLLGVLQDRVFARVGGTEPVEVDVRVVAATHRDLEKMVEAGTFRADLYYRLRVVEIRVPPLRERGPGDLERLVRHFVDRFARRHGKDVPGVTPEALARLTAHRWPGNVRELENCVESAIVLSNGGPLRAEQLSLPGPAPSDAVTPRAASGEGGKPLAIRPLVEVERDAIAAALVAFDGNRTAAAKALGIGRNTLTRKLASHARRSAKSERSR